MNRDYSAEALDFYKNTFDSDATRASAIDDVKKYRNVLYDNAESYHPYVCSIISLCSNDYITKKEYDSIMERLCAPRDEYRKARTIIECFLDLLMRPLCPLKCKQDINVLINDGLEDAIKLARKGIKIWR